MKYIPFFRSCFLPKAGFILSLILLMPLAPVYASGERIAILVDSQEQNKATLQMAERLEKDLKNILRKRGGYDTRILESRTDFRKGEGEYLLNVTLVKYKPGSKAARIIVGFGAGSASLDIHYELFSPREKLLLSKDDGCGTSLDWQRIARKLNENILAMITPVISGGGRAQESSEEESLKPRRRFEPSREIEEADESRPTSHKKPDPKSNRQMKKSSESPSPAEQLRELDQLRNEGLITGEEYESKRKEVLDRI